MIERIYKKERIAICDNCGEGKVFDSWADVIVFIYEEGWKKRLVDGKWKYYCPECQESEDEHDG